jgi:2-isopropylmalate synthase
VAYLPINPADVGRRYEEVVRINSQSGKGGVVHVLERDFGITLPRWLQVEFAKIVQREAEAEGGEVNGARIHQLFNQHYLTIRDGWKLQGYELSRSADVVSAQITVDGSAQPLMAKGSGAVSALVNALSSEAGVAIKVESFDEFSLGDNTASNALACVRMQVDSKVVSAAALADDTTSAALQAVLNAVSEVVPKDVLVAAVRANLASA